MSEPKDTLKELEGKLRTAVDENFSIEAIEKKFKDHIARLEKHHEEVAPKVKSVWERLVLALIELEAETDEHKRTRIQRRIGSLKRAHFNYLDSYKVAAETQAAESAWDSLERAKNFIVALIRMIPV